MSDGQSEGAGERPDPALASAQGAGGEGPKALTERQVRRLAKMYDLRFYIGALFLFFGVVVTLEGLFANEADIAKAAGVNIALWTGLAMLALSAVFLGWIAKSPPELLEGRELTEEDLPYQMRGSGRRMRQRLRERHERDRGLPAE